MGFSPRSILVLGALAAATLGACSNNDNGEITNVTPPATKPDAPSNLTATVASSTSIKLMWVDNSSYESGYRVERSTDGVTWTQVATAPANATSWTNYFLTAHTTYFYRVRAYEGSTNGDYSTVVSAATP